MQVISPFGPKIAKLKFSNKLIKKINLEVENILNKKKLLKKLDYSKKLVGQVKQEFQLPKTFIKKNLEKIISNEVKKYIYQTLGKKVKKISIKNFWIVRQFISKNEKKSKIDGTIDFINGNKMFLSDSIYNHQPKVGDVILFPHYLMHTAYPFKSNEERRSFSFNLEIDSKIANVFSNE